MLQRLMLVLALYFSIPIAHAATVSFLPSEQNVLIGSSFSVAIMGDFSLAEILEAGGLNLDFGSDVLNVTKVTVNTGLFEFFSDPGTIDNGAGTVTDIMFNTLSNDATGQFLIATVDFTAVDIGLSDLLLSESMLNPFYSAGMPLDVQFQSASVQVTPVPLPTALWFMFAGCALLWRRARPAC